MSQETMLGYQCTVCKAPSRRELSPCPDCGATGAARGHYDLSWLRGRLSLDALARREQWLWRYRELLPVDEFAELPPLQVGWTPLSGAPRLAEWAGVAGLWLKEEGRNPTGSLHDRAAAVALTRLRESGAVGFERDCAPREGAAFAAWSASLGLSARLSYGEAVSDEEQAFAALCGAAVPAASSAGGEGGQGFGSVSEAAGADGLATLGLELGEQLSERMADVLLLPESDARVARSIEAGFEAMLELGLCKRRPRLVSAEELGRDLAESELAEAMAQCARRAGLLVGRGGARSLAALAAGVATGKVGKEEMALVVLDAPLASPSIAPRGPGARRGRTA